MPDIPAHRFDRRRAPIVVGGVLSVLLVAALVYWVGPARVLSEVTGADPGRSALAGLAAMTALACRHAAYRRLYRSAGAGPVGVRFHLLVLLAGVPRWLLPAGYVGGPAINAYYLSRGIGARFRPTLAALAVVDFLGTVASAVVAGVGAALLVTLRAPSTVRRVATATAVVLLALVGAAIAVRLVRSGRIAGAVTRLGRVALNGLDRLGLTRGLPRRVREGSRDLVAAVGAVTDDRRGAAVAFLLVGVAWVASAGTLYFALRAVGAPAPIGVAMVVVPVSGLVGFVPLPAGIGTTELTLAGLLVVVGGVPAAAATSATLVFRVATLGLELVAGGGAGAALLAMGESPPSVPD